MSDFDSFIARHGEFGVQSLVERIERYEGIKPAFGSSLEERWDAAMQGPGAADRRMAA